MMSSSSRPLENSQAKNSHHKYFSHRCRPGVHTWFYIKLQGQKTKITHVTYLYNLLKIYKTWIRSCREMFGQKETASWFLNLGNVRGKRLNTGEEVSFVLSSHSKSLWCVKLPAMEYTYSCISYIYMEYILILQS